MDLWIESLPDLFGGLIVSLQLFTVSTIIGLSVGFLLAICAMSGSAIVRAVTLVVVEIGRGIPVLVMLQLVYFGLPSAGIRLDSMPAAWVALATTTACYSSEIIRGGLESIGSDQKEASRALGLGPATTFWHIIVPQGLVVSLAPLAGFSLQMFQATSLAFALSVPELLSRAYDIGSLTFRYLEILSLAGILYAAVGLPMLMGVSYLEKRMNGTRLSRGQNKN